jgi:hypothetical protein
MEFESILVSKALPDGTFSQKALIDAHRTITSSNDLRDVTAGTIRSSRGKFDACVYTRESVCREAASFERRSRNSVLGWYSTAPRLPQADLSARHSKRPENAQICSAG